MKRVLCLALVLAASCATAKRKPPALAPELRSVPLDSNLLEPTYKKAVTTDRDLLAPEGAGVR